MTTITHQANGDITIIGTLITAGKSSISGNTYLKKDLIKMVENFTVDGPFMGQIMDGSLSGYTTNIELLSHRINAVWMDGPDVKASVTLLDTPAGLRTKRHILDGYKMGVSNGYKPTPVMRGGLKVRDDDRVVNDLSLRRVDLIWVPPPDDEPA